MWNKTSYILPHERIRVIAGEQSETTFCGQKSFFIVGDCFYGACSYVTGEVYNEFFYAHEPIPQAHEKLWRYSETEKPVKASITHWMPLPEAPVD